MDKISVSSVPSVVNLESLFTRAAALLVQLHSALP